MHHVSESQNMVPKNPTEFQFFSITFQISKLKLQVTTMEQQTRRSYASSYSISTT